MNWLPQHTVLIPVTFLVMLGIAWGCRFYLGKRSPAVQKIPYQIISVLLIVGEIAKQAVALAGGEYPINYVPLHFSSTFYVSVAMAAFGRGRVEHWGYVISFVGILFCLGTTLVNPYAVVGDASFSDFKSVHSYLFHVLAIQFWLIMMFQFHYRPERKDFLCFFAFLGIWGAFAILGSHLLQVNYAGLLTSFLPFLETVRVHAGYAVYYLCYALLACAGSYLILLAYRLAAKAVIRGKEKRSEKGKGE